VTTEIYEIPHDVNELFEDIESNEGHMSYQIINYHPEMDMDNIQSMHHFTDEVGIDDYIEEDSGTQVVLRHPNYLKRVVIDASGLGDFYSHNFECTWEEE